MTGPAKRSLQAGLSMLEVLITLAVLSIGLAGMAGLQLASLQFVHSAHYRSLASTIALDFEERLWLELADDSLTGCPSSETGTGTPAGELIADWNREAAGDTWDWSTAKLLRIPNLAITVGSPVSGPSTTQIPITLGWNESRFSDAEDTAEQFAYVVRVACRGST